MSHIENVYQLLMEQVCLNPNAVAFVERRGGVDVAWTYEQLFQSTEETAKHLSSRGLKSGNKVLLLVPVSVRLYVLLLSLFKLNCTAVFIDPSAGLKRLDQCCEFIQPDALISTIKGTLLLVTCKSLRHIPTKIWDDFLRVPGNGDVRSDSVYAVRPAPDGAALITITSGSTGSPKAIARSHKFLRAQHRTLKEVLGLEPGKVQLTTLPVFVLANIASGITTVLPEANLKAVGTVDPAPVLSQIRQNHVNQIVCSPAFLERIVSAATPSDLAGISEVFTGGAAVMPHVVEAVKEKAPLSRLTAVYGSSECEPIAHVSGEEILGSGHTSGLPAGQVDPSVSLRIMRKSFFSPAQNAVPVIASAEFEQQFAPTGEIGEIVVCGDHVVSGYLNGTGDAETKFEVDGVRWHRTGDAGYLDARGKLWLVGRCHAQINDEKGSVYPFEVECRVGELKGVARTALVNVHGKRVLVIEPKPDWRYEPTVFTEIIQRYQIDRLEFVRHIPVDYRHNSKIDYRRLSQVLERRLA